MEWKEKYDKGIQRRFVMDRREDEQKRAFKAKRLKNKDASKDWGGKPQGAERLSRKYDFKGEKRRVRADYDDKAYKNVHGKERPAKNVGDKVKAGASGKRPARTGANANAYKNVPETVGSAKNVTDNEKAETSGEESDEGM